MAKNENLEILEELAKIDEMIDGPKTSKLKTTKKETKSKSKTKSKTTKKATKPKKETNKVDDKVIQSILKDLPDTVTTRDLNRIFEFNDGGKYLRRHLRSKFGSTHEPGTPWVWKKTDKQLIEIVEYFVTTLTPEKKQNLVCVGEDIINGN